MDKNSSSGQLSNSDELFRHVQKALRLGCWELRGEVPYADDFRILRQDSGEMRHIHTVGEVVVDCNGYPRRLSGRDIPLQARIFAIADTYVAMTEARPYRPTPGVAAAREEIRSQAGYQFDPALVVVFLDVYDADGQINERSCPTCMN